MKTQKTALTVMIAALMMVVTSLSFAGETEFNMAKKGLYQDLTETFNQDISYWNNYFYKHNINKINEEVKVSFVVEKDQSLSLLRVVTSNPEAKEYVEHLFKTKKMAADKMLIGKAFTFKLYLKYLAN